MINQNRRESYLYSQKEIKSIVGIIEQFEKEEVEKLNS